MNKLRLFFPLKGEDFKTYIEMKPTSVFYGDIIDYTPDDIPESYWHEFKYYIRCRRGLSGRGVPVVALRKAPFEVTLRLLTSVMNSVDRYSGRYSWEAADGVGDRANSGDVARMSSAPRLWQKSVAS